MPDDAPSPRRNLPIGLQTLREIREGDFYYVDKTAHVGRLVGSGKSFFLSRPRRFGKSLLLDTIKELFEGRETLFRGLAIHENRDWSKTHPVVRLSFGSGNFTRPSAVAERTSEQIASEAARHGVAPEGLTPEGRFADLLRALHESRGRRVVVLVDEYDKPILDALRTPEAARANRDFLRGLYSVIKDCDADIRFALLTGVSRFSKVNLFSGLNNLQDITLDPRYSSICGFTERDLETVFAPELVGLDLEQVRHWYNGYSWRGEQRVYNPFDVLLLFDRREFGAWWFETGTPTFLIDLLAGRGMASFDLEGMIADDALLSAFDVEDIAPEALLFQTGYLTIHESAWKAGRTWYRLGYPNREVRQSLNGKLLERLTGGGGAETARRFRLHDLLATADIPGLEAEFRALFAGIPSEWHTRNRIARYEGYYASVFHACLAAIGMDLRVEDSSAAGRLDLAALHEGQVWLFEFKVAERATPGAALAQLEEKGYADKYRSRGEPIHLVGVEFSEATRNLTAFEAARA